MLIALAFLLVHLVPAGFEILNVKTSGQVEALFEWLPATKIPLWAVQTNNHLEGQTETVMQQMNAGNTTCRGSVRSCAAYRARQRWVPALTTGRVYQLKHTNFEDKQWVCQRIYSEEASSASTDLKTAGQFPTYKKVMTIMYRSRAKRFAQLPAAGINAL
ncbi:hypothetical protein T10_9858 [Trichinella papuae]|uniref:Uncharacterized protein n=1 Tax=Trichinella papuae TaxID=268474 RepID=A0A0V1M9Q8_9BILA|nr:hypothetical protein T10_9858 [Trichinella papuae]